MIEYKFQDIRIRCPNQACQVQKVVDLKATFTQGNKRDDKKYFLDTIEEIDAKVGD